MYNHHNTLAYDQKQRIMSVIGIGEIAVQPNVVMIQLEVRTEDKKISQAHHENSLKMGQIIDSLIQFGISKENIQTTSFQVQPVYDYIDGRQEFRGYEVINMITVRTDQLDQVGHIIEIALQNGAKQILNVQFALEHSQIFERQALHKALEDAVITAQTIAQQMHLNLDPIPVKIEEELSEQPIPFLKTSMSDVNTLTPIEPGSIQVRAKVHVDFRY